MAAQLEAIEIKRKMFFEHEGAPDHCLDGEVSKRLNANHFLRPSLLTSVA